MRAKAVHRLGEAALLRCPYGPDQSQGVIEMAKDEQKNGRNVVAKKFADDVVKNQSAKVKQMRGVLDRL